VTRQISYVLPIRLTSDEGLGELTAYLRELSPMVDELLIVDNSPEPYFDRHAGMWKRLGRHIPPDPALRTPMGKVGNVLTAVREARNELLVIADDDVRWDRAGLTRAAALLDDCHLVRPQNYFHPLPWHARWDTARTLLNRATGRDFPGTLAVRRSAVLGAGGYDGDVMFENLELIRTIEAAGGRVISPLDLYVLRRPPSARHFRGQRVRQAYDELARPGRMALFLAAGPWALWSLARGRWRQVVAALAGAIGLAELGRRRAEGEAVFPASSSALAPVWVAERAVSSWAALWQRLVRGGIPYADGRIPRAASSPRRLRRRYRERGSGAATTTASAVTETGSSSAERKSTCLWVPSQ
jgi:hypothetical protein